MLFDGHTRKRTTTFLRMTIDRQSRRLVVVFSSSYFVCFHLFLLRGIIKIENKKKKWRNNKEKQLKRENNNVSEPPTCAIFDNIFVCVCRVVGCTAANSSAARLALPCRVLLSTIKKGKKKLYSIDFVSLSFIYLFIFPAAPTGYRR